MWPRLALVGLLLLAFALRLYRLPAQSLWYDEGVSWYLTRMSLPDLTVWTANDIQPPLYYYLLWVWVRLVGTGEYALRFLSVFFGVLTLPLLWTTGRRLLGRPAAWLAALFLTLSPLHVYYAQEARMYTLLTFLGLLSSFLLLRLLTARTANLVSPYVPWAYVLVTVAALYTHYFAFFLLAAHLLFVFYGWWTGARAGGRLKVSASGLPAASLPILIPIAILILYLPWIPFLLTRYGLDTSYWPGTLKLGEVARRLFITFSLGQTVTQQVGVWLAVGYGLIFLIGLAAWLVAMGERVVDAGRREQSRSATGDSLASNMVFLLIYLVVPVALVLLLTYRAPKFNPRYAMLASPAFILLIAGGLTSLVARYASPPGHHLPRIRRRLLVATGCLLATGFILATSVYSLRNWFLPYPDNQFNKADFRITAQIVRERLGADETVLLSSGHMFPAWAYYFGWDGWHRLPDIEVLDVNAALDLSVGDELDPLLRGKQGVWLVRWQNEVTDPFDVLPLYLGTIGVQDDYGQFWHMELAHYRLPSDAHFDVAGFITHRADADFGQKVRLLGVRQTSGSEIILFWQAIDTMGTDYTIFVHMLDAAGETLVNADHLPLRPTREWRPGQIIPDRVGLPLPSGLPGGDYRLEVGLYDAADPSLPRLAVEHPQAGNLDDRVLVPFRLETDDLE